MPLRVWAATFLGGLAITAALVAAYATVAGGRGGQLDVLFDGPRFELTDHLGRTARSEDFRGKVVVANFVYTNCPDVCPLLSAQMQTLQTRLRDEKLLGDRVQLLSFTVDPARDTPAVLRAYAERYRADPSAWRFLTGPEGEVLPLVVDGFHMGVQVLPPTPGAAGHGGDAHEPYEVMHSGRFVLLDRRWRVRAVPDASDFDPDQAVADIRRLLR